MIPINNAKEDDFPPVDPLLNPVSNTPYSSSSAISDTFKCESAAAAPPSDLRGNQQTIPPQPTISTPHSSTTSIVGAFRAWTDAARAFRNQLSASHLANLEIRRKFNESAIAQTLSFSELLKDRELFLAQISKEIQIKEEELSNLLNEMTALAEAQQNEITKIKDGNAQEKDEYQKVAQAYQTFLTKMEEAGAKDIGSGEFSTPLGMEATFDPIWNEYREAVSSFNQYWQQRAPQIDAYNTAAAAYNQKVAEYNQAVNTFIYDNHLADFMREKEMLIPQLTPTTWRDPIGSIMTMPTRKKGMYSIVEFEDNSTIYKALPLPSQTSAAAKGTGFPILPSLPNFSKSAEAILNPVVFKAIYDELYANQVEFLDHAILQYQLYTAYVLDANKMSNEEDPSIELLNTKKIEKKLAHTVQKDLAELNKKIESSHALQKIELDRLDLQILLGSLLIKKIISDSAVRLSENKGRQIQQISTLSETSDSLLLLSTGLMSSLSIQSLFPGLGILSDHLAALPKNSPAFSLTFAVSFINRLCENIHNGLNGEAITAFSKAIPALSSATPGDLDKLEASINLGQLIIATKLLENSLGLPGLFKALAAAAASDIDFAQLTSQAMADDVKMRADTTKRIVDHFTSRGFPIDKATFLANTLAILDERTLLAPSIPGPITQSGVDFAPLKQSIQAGMALLTSLPMAEILPLSEVALSRTFAQAPLPSPAAFTFTLAAHLSDLGIAHSQEIAPMALLLPKTDISLVSETSLVDWKSLIAKRVEVLLPPQIAQEFTQEVIKTIFGISSLAPANSSPARQSVPPTDEAKAASETQKGELPIDSSPYALINILNAQLYRLNQQDQAAWSLVLHDTFAEGIKTMTNFPAFAKKLLDPAYQYVLASSLIYQSQRIKNKIDIPI